MFATSVITAIILGWVVYVTARSYVLRSCFKDLWVGSVDTTSAAASVVVYMVSEGSRPFARHTIARARQFCDQHGYRFELLKPGRDFEFPSALGLAPQWLKIPATLAVMDKFPAVSAYLWLDDDVFITNTAKTLDGVLMSAPAKSVFVGRDYSEPSAIQPGNMINTGVMLCRNTAQARKVVEKVWEHTASDKQFNSSLYHEQSVLGNLCLDERFRNQIAVTNVGVLQSFIHPDAPRDFRWTHGDFAVHVCAEADTRRQQIFESLERGNTEVLA